MAAEGRGPLTLKMNNNVYDNNAKEIDPQKVRTILAALIESNFNMVDDVFPIPLWGATGSFDIGANTGAISSNQGIVSSATNTKLSNNDCVVTIELGQSISGRKITVGVFTTSSSANQQNDIGTPVIRVVDNNTITVALREVAQVTQSLRLEILAFKTT